MIASVHLADVGMRRSLALLRKPPKAGSVDGLRQAHVATAAPLSGSTLPSPTWGRVGLIAFWEDEDALHRFESEHPLAHALAGGWRVQLEPLRAFGSWPGLPDAIPDARNTANGDDGAALVLTLARLRLTQARRFLRTSARAEAAALEAPGVIFATGLARPPFVATCSLWESSRALMTYAYGHRQPAHTGAIDADQVKPFHKQSAFIRFRPSDSRGGMGGSNPLAEAWMATAARA